jgi:hypothetical protein
MKITALVESTDFANPDTAKFFTKLKSHELSREDHPNHDACFTNKTFVTSTRVGGHVANPPTLLTHLLWSLSCPLWTQLLMSSMRASPMMRSPYW